MIDDTRMTDDDKSVKTPLAAQQLGDHGLTAEDQDFSVTREDVEVHPSV